MFTSYKVVRLSDRTAELSAQRRRGGLLSNQKVFQEAVSRHFWWRRRKAAAKRRVWCPQTGFKLQLCPHVFTSQFTSHCTFLCENKRNVIFLTGLNSFLLLCKCRQDLSTLVSWYTYQRGKVGHRQGQHLLHRPPNLSEQLEASTCHRARVLSESLFNEKKCLQI